MEAGLVDEFTLLRVLDEEEKSQTIDEVLIGTGVLDDESIAKSMAKQLKLPFIRLQELHIPQEVINLVPVEVAKTHLLAPVKIADGKLLVAMVNPLDAEALQVLRMTTNKRIEIVVAARDDILAALVKYYPSEFLDQMLDGAPDEDDVTADF
jgi:type IV pilus assembly protein PilB